MKYNIRSEEIKDFNENTKRFILFKDKEVIK